MNYIGSVMCTPECVDYTPEGHTRITRMRVYNKLIYLYHSLVTCPQCLSMTRQIACYPPHVSCITSSPLTHMHTQHTNAYIAIQRYKQLPACLCPIMNMWFEVMYMNLIGHSKLFHSCQVKMIYNRHLHSQNISTLLRTKTFRQYTPTQSTFRTS